MKLVSYKTKKADRVGILFGDLVYDLKRSAASLKIKLPSTMKEFLEDENKSMRDAKKVLSSIRKKKIRGGIKLSRLKIISPVPYPSSLRDGYAFRQHVFTARRNR